MEVSKLITTLVLFTFIPFILTKEMKHASPDEANELNLTCYNGSSISIQTFWSNSLNESCPNRNKLDIFIISLKIVAYCQLKQNCSVDLTNHTVINCTNYKNEMDVQYICNATTTSNETQEESNDDVDDDQDDDSIERETTTTTKKPHYAFQPVPVLLTTLRPTKRPAHLPQPLLPVPAPELPHIRPRPPLFPGFNNLNFNPQPMFMPLPLPMPVPIPLFG